METPHQGPTFRKVNFLTLQADHLTRLPHLLPPLATRGRGGHRGQGSKVKGHPDPDKMRGVADFMVFLPFCEGFWVKLPVAAIDLLRDGHLVYEGVG